LFGEIWENLSVAKIHCYAKMEQLTIWVLLLLFCGAGTWTQGLTLLGRHSTTWPTPPAPICVLENQVIIFKIFKKYARAGHGGNLPATWEVEIELWLEASPGKKLVRLYIKGQSGHGGIHLQFQLHERQK
jgi:hypothetical protein